MRRITLMETNNHSMLALLEKHATTHTDSLAHVLPLRDITYRRLWSRIERGSARLHGEWGVQRGDLVAYVGNGHPDAIVLYFSLLRIGASLLPLEAMTAADVNKTLAAMKPALVVHDDDVVLADDDMTRRALLLPDGNGQWQACSLFELCAMLPAAPRSTFIGDRIFTSDLLTHVVLPSLRDACLMQFAATDRIFKTAS